jgi:hypothetical protein
MAPVNGVLHELRAKESLFVITLFYNEITYFGTENDGDTSRL